MWPISLEISHDGDEGGRDRSTPRPQASSSASITQHKLKCQTSRHLGPLHHSQRYCIVGREECGILFFDRSEQVNKPKVRYDFSSPNPKFGACVKVFIPKNSRGPKYNFFVKMGMKLPFTLKNKRQKKNLKLDFLKLPFWTPEKVHFWFLKEKKPKKFCLRVSAFIQL